MKILKSLLLTLILSTTLFSQNKEVDTLLEKVNEAPNKKTKTQLIEQLKVKLAIKNKKAKEEANAIIKAKKKIPTKIYDEKSINGK